MHGHYRPQRDAAVRQQCRLCVVGPPGTIGCILSICSVALAIEPLNMYKSMALHLHMLAVSGREWESNCVCVSVWSDVLSPFYFCGAVKSLWLRWSCLEFCLLVAGKTALGTKALWCYLGKCSARDEAVSSLCLQRARWKKGLDIWAVGNQGGWRCERKCAAVCVCEEDSGGPSAAYTQAHQIRQESL